MSDPNYFRNIATLRKCQLAYDNATPPEYDDDPCDDCTETSCDGCEHDSGDSYDPDDDDFRYEEMKDKHRGL